MTGNADSLRRVLIVSRMFPRPGAPADGPFILEQVKALRLRGLDARVMSGRNFPLCLRRPLSVPRRLGEYRRAWSQLEWSTFDGVPVLYVPYHVGWAAKLLRLDDPYRDAIVRGGQWLCDSFDYDLIHAHTAHPDGFACQALAKLHGKPLVITEHTGPFASLTRTPGMRKKTLAALAAAERVWCVSHALCREVTSYFPPEEHAFFRTLYNGVDTKLFSPPAVWQPDPQAPRLLFVGLFEPIKNVPLLVEAFAVLKKTVPGAQLRIVGYGSQQSAVERVVAGRGLSKSVTLHGQMNRAQLADEMRNGCDLLVLPSQSETFGVVLIEALASGKPVVASRCGGPESIVTDPRLGALCIPNDVADLARCLEETVARLPAFSREFIRRHAVETFDYGILSAALVEQYREVIDQFHRTTGEGQIAAA